MVVLLGEAGVTDTEALTHAVAHVVNDQIRERLAKLFCAPGRSTAVSRWRTDSSLLRERAFRSSA
jgi:hypothetical protein